MGDQGSLLRGDQYRLRTGAVNTGRAARTLRSGPCSPESAVRNTGPEKTMHSPGGQNSCSPGEFPVPPGRAGFRGGQGGEAPGPMHRLPWALMAGLYGQTPCGSSPWTGNPSNMRTIIEQKFNTPVFRDSGSLPVPQICTEKDFPGRCSPAALRSSGFSNIPGGGSTQPGLCRGPGSGAGRCWIQRRGEAAAGGRPGQDAFRQIFRFFRNPAGSRLISCPGIVYSLQ